ncbi:hypothetical protein ACWDE9_37495 [Streptomyces olivaceoviridis]
MVLAQPVPGPARARAPAPGDWPGRVGHHRRRAARRRPEGGSGPWGAAGAGTRDDGPLPVLDRWSLAGDAGRRYGAASRDRNPTHPHPLTARLSGSPQSSASPSAIAQGRWTVARRPAAHGTPDAAEVRARFQAPVPLPGTIAYGADRDGRSTLRGLSGRLHAGSACPARYVRCP